MKHARKKQTGQEKKSVLHNKEQKKPQQASENYHHTTEDFRRKYLFDDTTDKFSRKLADSGYKPRKLDSYIPAERLESKVKVNHNIDDATRRIDVSKIVSAAEDDMKRKRSAAAGKPAGSRSQTKTGTNTEKKAGRKTTKKAKSSKPHAVLKKVLAACGIIVFIGCIILVGIGAGMYSAIANEIEEMNIETLALNYSSFVYYTDSDGNAQELVQLHYEGERRVWADSAEISDNLKNAAVAIEDQRFYKHNGVDLKRTIGATIKYALSKIGIGESSYGGSTLTQQLIKNITNEKEKSALRKIKEMMRAIALEKQIDNKDTILTMYLNISFFANQCYGVEAASNFYFSKHASEVTIPEAAMIVGITQYPTYYDPIQNPENALEKRNIVLSKMYELGYITEEEYNSAKDSPLGLSEGATNRKTTVYSYFVDQVINDVTADLIEQKGYAQNFAEQQVYSGGLKIYTTMDYDVQEAMEDVFENRTGFPSSTKPQAAMIVIDPYNGEIKGMVGGAGKKTEPRGLNRATQSKRQPGSSIKPLSVYAPGIELGKINSATVLRDEKITIDDWSPSNSYTGFKGDMTLRSAIEVSANIPAIKALQLLGIENSYDYLTNHFGFTTLVDDDKNLSALSLGGMTNGVTVRELAAAYATFPNGGMYVKPYTYTKVVDSTGRVLLENTPEPKRAISESTAFIMTDLLHEVIYGSSGTGKTAKLSGMTAYGKTGTTNENKDKWFVGFTKYYVGAVWFGFDQPQNLRSVGITNNPSCVIWKNVMNKIHNGLDDAEFTPPSSVKAASICSKTGKLASSGCRYAEKDYFVAGNMPTRFCKLSHGGASSGTTTTTATKAPDTTDEQTDSDEGDTPPKQTSGSSQATPAPEVTAAPAHTQAPTTPNTPSNNSGSNADDGFISLD